MLDVNHEGYLPGAYDEFISVSGDMIEQALIRAHKANYNRSFNDLNRIEPRMLSMLDDLSVDLAEDEKQEIFSNFNNDWRRALYPVSALMVHKHKQFKPCEPHMRVKIGTDMIVDVTMDDYNDWCMIYKLWKSGLDPDDLQSIDDLNHPDFPYNVIKRKKGKK
jgi:bisphosphoglycerate-independent phosphoglycerate mutase (AlkP superfamily)